MLIFPNELRKKIGKTEKHGKKGKNMVKKRRKKKRTKNGEKIGNKKRKTLEKKRKNTYQKSGGRTLLRGGVIRYWAYLMTGGLLTACGHYIYL